MFRMSSVTSVHAIRSTGRSTCGNSISVVVFGLCKVTLLFFNLRLFETTMSRRNVSWWSGFALPCIGCGLWPNPAAWLVQAHRSVYDGIYADKSHLFKLPAHCHGPAYGDDGDSFFVRHASGLLLLSFPLLSGRLSVPRP